MVAQLACFDNNCRATFPITEVIYNCPRCGGLLEVVYSDQRLDAATLKSTWRERRKNNNSLDQSGVWRYRELIGFLDDYSHVVSLREGNTPLLDAPQGRAVRRLGSADVQASGFQPDRLFQGQRDDVRRCAGAPSRNARVACVSTGNTSASMAAYAAAAGLAADHLHPARQYLLWKAGAGTRIWRPHAPGGGEFRSDPELWYGRWRSKLGIYLFNSINPFRIEGQKSIIIEMMDQRDWEPPDWIVLPGGNLGKYSAFGKALRRTAPSLGFISRMPKLAVIQAEGAAPFYEFMRNPKRGFQAVETPETLATAIRIGDPVSWPKAWHEVTRLAVWSRK